MQLTKEQLEAARSGETVRLQTAGAELVVVRADLFDRLQGLAYDAGSWTDQEMALLAAEDADALGWDGMEPYQDDDQ
jgi:hypothetical protein